MTKILIIFKKIYISKIFCCKSFRYGFRTIYDVPSHILIKYYFCTFPDVLRRNSALMPFSPELVKMWKFIIKTFKNYKIIIQKRNSFFFENFLIFLKITSANDDPADPYYAIF